MNNFRCCENDFGLYIDYIYTQNNNKKCLRLCEDDDYFSFSIFSPDIQLVNSERITINKTNPIFSPLTKLIENATFIEILEEGTDEGKSIAIQSDKNCVHIIFNLKNIPTNTTSISITNVRLASPNVTFGNNSQQIDNFKNKLHYFFKELKEALQNYSM